MNEPFADSEVQLEAVLVREARGPKRNGAFALWLFTRVASGLTGPDQVSPRGHRRRLHDLERRFASLSVPPPLRRALVGGVRQLDHGTPEAAAVALQQLVAPVRETLGTAAAEAVALAARRVRTASDRKEA